MPIRATWLTWEFHFHDNKGQNELPQIEFYQFDKFKQKGSSKHKILGTFAPFLGRSPSRYSTTLK